MWTVGDRARREGLQTVWLVDCQSLADHLKTPIVHDMRTSHEAYEHFASGLHVGPVASEFQAYKRERPCSDEAEYVDGGCVAHAEFGCC